MFLSCTSNVDFNQVDDIEVNQNFTFSFIYLNANQNNFLNADGTSETNSLSDSRNIDIFKLDYFQENLIEVNFNFEIENTFNRDFELEFTFLNADDAITTNFMINIPSNSKLSHLETYEGLDLLSLKLTEKVKITVDLQPSSDASILNRDDETELTIKSSANFIFRAN